MSGRSNQGQYDLSSPLSLLTDAGLFGPLLLREEAQDAGNELERHFNDLYHLFLNRFARLSHEPQLSDEAAVQLQALLAELLAVKKKLAEQ